jgi:hypothetical protein
MQVASRKQFAKHNPYATDLVQIAREKLSARLEIRDQGCALKYFGNIIERKAQARLVRNRRQMEAGVGRPTGCSDRCGSILQTLPGDQIAR